MRFSKPSDIKAKLEEIIADQKDKEKQPTVRRLNTSGAPGVDTTPATIPGVIRARSVVPPGSANLTEAAGGESGDDRMIRGNVKVIADDRTSTLIIITRQENMRFFEQVVAALDVSTAPDVTIEVLRLEYADAEEVASMLNALIGAAASPSSKSSTPKKTTTTSTTRPDGSPGPTATTSTTREEPRSFQLQEFIDQQRQLAGAKGAEGKTKVGQLSAENIKILADKRTNGLILMASKGDMAALKDILKGMDVMLSQVLIEAVIMQVSLDKNLERGVDWVQRSMIAYDQTASGGRDPLFAFAGQGGGGKTVPINASTINSAAGIGGAGGLTYYFTQFGLNIDAVIKMSQSDNRSKIIASPVILTTDNKEAKIDVSEERYFYKGVSYSGYVSGAQQQAIPNVESRKVGLTLTVTPRINAKKFVVMEIAQKIENVNGTQTISDGTGGNNEWPIVASREMNASVSVRSGETIILGGLVEKNSIENKSGIPFLSKIPFLGFLFGSHSDTGKRAEIVVFITPYVLDSPEEIETESARRKAALSETTDGLWEKGWSDSNLADPPKNRRGIKSLLK
jgi:general secretion pathway protein D